MTRAKEATPIFIFLAMLLAPVAITGRFSDGLTLAACLLCFVLYFLTEQTQSFLLQFFFVVFLYLALFPFYLQSVAGWDMRLTGQALVPMSPRTFLAISLFLLAVAISGLATKGPSVRGAEVQGAARSLLRKKLAIPTLVLFGVLLAGIALAGGALLFVPRDALLSHGRPASAVQFLGYILRITPCWMLFFVLWRAAQTGRSLVSVRHVLLFCLVLLVNNPVTTARYISLSGILVAIVPVLVAKGQLNRFKVLFPLLVWLVLPVSSLVRGGLRLADWSELVGFVLTSAEFSTLMLLNDWMTGNQDASLTLGLQSASAVLILVPRAIWQAKNPGTGPMLAEAQGYSYTNIAVTPIADFFMDFSWFGVLLGGLALGFVLKRFGTLRMKEMGGFSVRSGIPITLLALMPSLVRGDLSVFFIAFYAFLFSHKVMCTILRLRG